MTTPDPITTARKQFPILSSKGATIDWQLVQDHGKQAHSNHYQTVERLAERGGLAWQELYYVLTDQPFVYGSGMIGDEDAINGCRLIERRYLGDDIAGLKAELEKLKAERDEWKGNYERVASDGDAARSEITRLTSQLEQAEKVIAPFAKCGEGWKRLPDVPLDVSMQSPCVSWPADFMSDDLIAAFQWIKDRQAEGGG